MEKQDEKVDLDEIKSQIDLLEAKLRAAETETNSRLEDAAPIRTIYKWQAPERIFEPKNRSWYVTVAFFVILIVAYSALTANYLLILALIVLLILLYALNTFPPKMIEHEITNKGIKTLDRIYTWNRIESFWVSKRSNQYLLNINLFEGSVKRMILLIGDADAGKIVQELVKRVDYINPGGTRQDILSKLTEGRHVPLTEFLDVFEESKKKGIELEQKKTV